MNKRNMSYNGVLVLLRSGVAASAIMLSCAAFAQVSTPVQDSQDAGTSVNSSENVSGSESLPQESSAPSTEDIVVTGTLLRGIAPAGSNVIGISEAQIEATGASTTNDLLANLPQAGNFFNGLAQPGGGATASNTVVPINRPSLRNLPGNNTSGGALTLILIDGHRVVGAGIGQVAVDPDIIPPGALQRVETITDGGSAVYGSDAIGGVINFITLKRFDGVKVDGHYGFADDYDSYDANVTAGKDWGSGSAYVAYSFSRHDALLGRDRDFVQQIDWATGIPTGRQCDLPNITTVSGTRTFAMPDRVLGTFNACDVTDYQTFYAADRQHHVLAGLTQDLSDAITFDVRAFYSERRDVGNSGPLLGTVTVTSASPFYINLPGADAGRPQAVSFSYGPAFGNDAAKNRTWLKTWNITPSVTADLGGGWQLRGLANYGESFTKYANDVLFAARQTAAAAAGTLNPYDIASTSSTVLDSLRATNVGRAWHEFTDFRAILDGTLLTLPGGDVRLAVGAEYFRTIYTQQLTNTTTFTPNPRLSYTQSVKSLFGEIQVPIFGADNGFAGMESLNISASGRYDKYNDFGDTFNPKLGLTYQPVDWITIYGNWGKSFSAPSPTDQLGVDVATSLVRIPGNFPTGATLTPALVPGQTTYSFVLLRGAVAGLKPQTSTNWSIGAKVKPPFIPGLTLSGSYYFIRYNDAIGSPQRGIDTQVTFREYPHLVTIDPTPEQLQAFAAQVNGGLANLATIPAGARIVSMYDIRSRNLGDYRLSGLDFAANYVHDTGFGSIDASFSGNYQLMLESQTSPTTAPIDALATGQSKLRFSSTLGATVGNLRAQATWNHSAGFDVTRSAALVQDHVKAYNVFNLYFRYDVNGSGLAQDLSFSLNVNNLLDKDPPALRDRGNLGFTNGLTVGRLIQFGISKKF